MRLNWQIWLWKYEHLSCDEFQHNECIRKYRDSKTPILVLENIKKVYQTNFRTKDCYNRQRNIVTYSSPLASQSTQYLLSSSWIIRFKSSWRRFWITFSRSTSDFVFREAIFLSIHLFQTSSNFLTAWTRAWSTWYSVTVFPEYFENNGTKMAKYGK